MAHWFLSTRAQAVGGPVAAVKILDAERPGYPYDLTQELMQTIRGRDVFLGTHGFEVNQADGIAHLTYWLDNLQINNAVPIGILWPGDCTIPVFLDYIVEGHEAIKSGQLLATFINATLSGAVSLSFASHSLGARVVLQIIAGLASTIHVRRAILMAGAIDDNCLTAEYRGATNKIDEISLLASTCDDVLALAYPLGNPLQGIIDRGHPYYHAALGRNGPAQPYPAPPRLRPNWQIPANLNYGHLDYMPGQLIVAAFPLPVEIPPDNGPVPPGGTPLQLPGPKQWKPAWSAAFASSRYG